MPELPEVETIVRDLKTQPIFGETIQKASVYWPRSIATPDYKKFITQIKSDKILDVSRRAKFIVLKMKSGWSLLIHLRMSGRVMIAKKEELREKHQHVILHFQNGYEFRFQDPRKFGRWYFLKDTTEKFQAIGPEPLEATFTSQLLAQRLAGKKRQLKPLLLDQSILAGLGNIYVDEALWESKLHPEQTADTLSSEDLKRLHKAIRLVLRRGVKNLGTSLGESDTNYYSVGKRRGRNQDQLKVFRRTGEPCPGCGKRIERIIVGQRSTHVCSRCQKIPTS